MHDAHLDAEVARLNGEGLGECLQRPFAGAVGADQREYQSSLDAGDEHEVSRSLLTHRGKQALRHPQGTQGVELEEPLDFRERDAFQGCSYGLTGIADEHIDLAGILDGLVDALLNSDIEAQALVDGQVSQRFRTTRGGDHAVAPAGQFDGDGSADALGRAGDQYGRHGGTPR